MYKQLLAFDRILSKCKSQLHGSDWKVTPSNFRLGFHSIEARGTGKALVDLPLRSISQVFLKLSCSTVNRCNKKICKIKIVMIKILFSQFLWNLTLKVLPSNKLVSGRMKNNTDKDSCWYCWKCLILISQSYKPIRFYTHVALPPGVIGSF